MSPQRRHTPSRWVENSAQQTSQIGTEDSRGKGEPQRAQEEGNKAQPRASSGLRSTRATARQREMPGGETAIVSEPESWLKTHLTHGQRRSVHAASRPVYARCWRASIEFGRGKRNSHGQRRYVWRTASGRFHGMKNRGPALQLTRGRTPVRRSKRPLPDRLRLPPSSLTSIRKPPAPPARAS